jgi:hypothetical protein
LILELTGLPAVGTESVELEGVPLDGESGTRCGVSQSALGETDIDLLDAVAAGADEMVVVSGVADAVATHAVTHLDSVQHTQVYQDVHGAEQGGAAQLRIDLLELLPELLSGEVGPRGGVLGEAGAAGYGAAPPPRRRP